MSSQYHVTGASVKTPAQKTVKTVKPAPKERQAATFTPYFHHAYNEIVNPRRFDHYFVQRWMRVLGPVAFALVKALRDLCYHNPSTGVLRDSVELTIEELAEIVGVSPSTVKRELAGNEALARFVQREKQYTSVGGCVVRKANRWRVSMDEPIHPDDEPRYQALLQGEQAQDACTGQNDPDEKSEGLCRGHFDLHNKGQNDLYYKGQNDPVNNSLPSGGFITKEKNTPEASPPINPPKGEDAGAGKAPAIGEGSEWGEALSRMRGKIGAMTYNCCLKRLQWVEDSDNGVRLRAPDPLTRGQAEKETVLGVLVSTLSEMRGKAVSVSFV